MLFYREPIGLHHLHGKWPNSQIQFQYNLVSNRPMLFYREPIGLHHLHGKWPNKSDYSTNIIWFRIGPGYFIGSPLGFTIFTRHGPISQIEYQYNLVSNGPMLFYREPTGLHHLLGNGPIIQIQFQYNLVLTRAMLLYREPIGPHHLHGKWPKRSVSVPI